MFLSKLMLREKSSCFLVNGFHGCESGREFNPFGIFIIRIVVFLGVGGAAWIMSRIYVNPQVRIVPESS